LFGEHLREAFDAPLRGLIGGGAGCADASADGGDLDDVAGPLLPHDRDRGLRHVDDAEEIGLDPRAEVGEARLLDGADVAGARAAARACAGSAPPTARSPSMTRAGMGSLPARRNSRFSSASFGNARK